MISLSNIIYMLTYLVISVTGLIFLKLSDGKFFSFNGLTGIVLYGVGFIIWYLILSRVSLSVAFPVAAGGLVVATQIGGYFILKESISITHMIGVLLIIIGISVVASGDAQLWLRSPMNSS